MQDLSIKSCIFFMFRRILQLRCCWVHIFQSYVEIIDNLREIIFMKGIL